MYPTGQRPLDPIPHYIDISTSAGFRVSAGHYRLNLGKAIKNMYSFTVKTAYAPTSFHNIGEHTSTFYLTTSPFTTPQKITLPDAGKFSAVDVAELLNKYMDTLTGVGEPFENTTFRFVYDDALGKMTIVSNATSQHCYVGFPEYDSNSVWLARLLGYAINLDYPIDQFATEPTVAPYQYHGTAGVHELEIHVPELVNKNQWHFTGGQDHEPILVSIPVDYTSSAAVTYYSPSVGTTPLYVFHEGKTVKEIDLYIIAKTGYKEKRLVDLQGLPIELKCEARVYLN